MLQGVVAVAASSSLNRASGSHTPQFMVVSQQQRDRRDPATVVLEGRRRRLAALTAMERAKHANF